MIPITRKLRIQILTDGSKILCIFQSVKWDYSGFGLTISSGKLSRKTITLPRIVWAANKARQMSSGDVTLFLDAFTETRKQLSYGKEITTNNA